MTREEAIDVVKKNWPDSRYTSLREALEFLIPELKESEDERIRKEIVEYLKLVGKGDEDYAQPMINRWLAYLEKQKEASKAIEAVERIDKYIDEYLANAHEMKDSNSEKEYYLGWDAALGKMSGILQDVYSGEKREEKKSVDIEYKLPLDAEKQKEIDDASSTIQNFFNKEQKAIEWNPTNEDVILFNKAITTNTTLTPDERAKLDIIRMKFKHRPIIKQEQKHAEWNANDKAFIKDCARILDENGYAASAERLLSMFPIGQAEWSEDWREEDIQTRFAFYTYKDDPSTLYLSNVFVEEASRNHGFGTRILRAAEKVAETIGATTISLKVKQDSPANAWYRKNGYEYVAFEDGYDWLKKNLEYMKPNKQGWSEEDKDYYDTIVSKLEIIGDDSGLSNNQIKFLREHCPSHYSNEWSQDNQKMLGDIIRYLEVQKEDRDAPFFDLAISFLKSLRPSWKPNEEELVALKCAGGTLRDCGHSELAKMVFMIEGKLANLSIINKSIWKPNEEQMKALEASYSVLKTHDTWGEDEHLPILMSLINDLQKLL